MENTRKRRQKPKSERYSKAFQIMLKPRQYYRLQRMADEKDLAAAAIIRRRVFGEEDQEL